MEEASALVGVDVGSTTVKIAVVDPLSHELLHAVYERHHAEQSRTVHRLLSEAHRLFPAARFHVAVCGSGGQTVAERLGAHFVQEVVANALAVKHFHPEARVAVELGGQDAKVIFFRYDEQTEQVVAHDMRMNGSCAGGTGAFIDQIAELLGVDIEDFGALAAQGETLYDISGRCGVFAKTDIQPLLNQGVAPHDIALSSFHAIAKQTIGGLAQGMRIDPPVIFEGGPLTFNPALVRVFQERLGLTDEQTIVPSRPEIIVAHGAALALPVMFADRPSDYRHGASLEALASPVGRSRHAEDEAAQPFFSSSDEEERFYRRHAAAPFAPPEFPSGAVVPCYLGIDAGSTTSKFVLLSEDDRVLNTFYSNNRGDPLSVIQQALLMLRDTYRDGGVALEIRGIGTTGYGEMLFATALKADYHTVETVAHAEAARLYAPDVSFILDIGGQDMKAIFLNDGIVTGIVLNEACSAGCGSFIETYARSLRIPVEHIAPMAFGSTSPSRLGSRCTVFMNSSIITEQKNGKGTEDILAGICRSIVENVFTKVVRVSSLEALGDTIVVQGGTFKNDAVLRAFEQYTGRTVIRPDLPGEMGAIGIALLTKKYVREQGDGYRSRFIGLDALESFSYQKRPGVVCSFCTNSCNRTVVTFGDGTHFVTGNRCERGQIIGDAEDALVRRKVAETTRAMRSVPDLVRSHNRLLASDFPAKTVRNRQNLRIGLPRALEMWESLPFWKALFTSLGYDVVVSKRSTYELFDQALPSVPSDTICFPAKLVHGHVKDLIDKGVDRIFMPMMIHMPKENATAEACHVCSVVQGYPLVVAQADEPERRHGVELSKPMFYWQNRRLKREQLLRYCMDELGATKRQAVEALRCAEAARTSMQQQLRDEAARVLASLEGTNDFAVLLAGRPYHSDELVNHHLASYFTRLGIPVVTLNAVEELSREDLRPVRMETTIPFHARMMSAALFAARHPNLELVQVVSFGCGHDAIISDEMIRLLHEASDKEMLVLKLDEGEAQGPLSIRVKSFVETVRQRRRRFGVPQAKQRSIRDGFPAKFLRRDKRERVVLVPTLSPAFSTLIARVVEMEGYRCLTLPPADAKAIALGKQYVHNDICFPAQVNIGEALSFLRRGHIDPDHVAVGLAKNCEDCRAGQYAALARKALDQAGYPNVPIITTGIDRKGMHPGFSLSPLFEIRMIWGLSMVDGLETMRRAVRPYETSAGESDGVFQRFLARIVNELERGAGAALSVFSQAVDAFNRIRVDRSERKPRVGVVGEILLNYHPSANCRIEEYLERNGMEVVLPNLIDFFRRGFVALREKALRRVIPGAFINRLTTGVADFFFNKAASLVEEHLRRFAFWEPRHSIEELTDNIRDLVDPSYEVGEGWLMPAEMVQLLKRGINSVVIVQPFGCLPNHITGRGLVKPIKERFPHAQILSLDYDPDTSLANIENRLQMLIITARELEKRRSQSGASAQQDAAAAVRSGGGGS